MCKQSLFFWRAPPSADALRLFPAAHFQLSSNDDTSTYIQLFNVLSASPLSPLPGAKTLRRHQEGGKKRGFLSGTAGLYASQPGIFFCILSYFILVYFWGESYLIAKSCFQSNKSNLFGCLKGVCCHHVWSHQGKT